MSDKGEKLKRARILLSTLASLNGRNPATFDREQMRSLAQEYALLSSDKEIKDQFRRMEQNITISPVIYRYLQTIKDNPSQVDKKTTDDLFQKEKQLQQRQELLNEYQELSEDEKNHLSFEMFKKFFLVDSNLRYMNPNQYDRYLEEDPNRIFQRYPNGLMVYEQTAIDAEDTSAKVDAFIVEVQNSSNQHQRNCQRLAEIALKNGYEAQDLRKAILTQTGGNEEQANQILRSVTIKMEEISRQNPQYKRNNTQRGERPRIAQEELQGSIGNAITSYGEMLNLENQWRTLSNRTNRQLTVATFESTAAQKTGDQHAVQTTRATLENLENANRKLGLAQRHLSTQVNLNNNYLNNGSNDTTNDANRQWLQRYNNSSATFQTMHQQLTSTDRNASSAEDIAQTAGKMRAAYLQASSMEYGPFLPNREQEHQEVLAAIDLIATQNLNEEERARYSSMVTNQQETENQALTTQGLSGILSANAKQYHDQDIVYPSSLNTQRSA